MSKRGGTAAAAGNEGDDVLSRTSLSLAEHPLPDLDSLRDTLSRFANLRRLDLCNMAASPDNPSGLTTLAFLAPVSQTLTWLNAASNASLVPTGLETLRHLVVLNLSHCSLRTLPPVSPLSTLKALVLSHNEIETLGTLPRLPELNTLILSHNKISSLPASLTDRLPAIKKLSVAHNDLKGELPDLTTCSALREVRLNGNKRLDRLPPTILSWGRGKDRSAPGLETLDLGDCALNNWESLSGLATPGEVRENTSKKGLGNLSLRGNGVASLPEFRETVVACHPTLRVLDNERIVPKSGPPQKKESSKATSSSQRKERQRDNGYSQVRKAASPDEASDEEDDEAARMAAEMRRQLRGGKDSQPESEPVAVEERGKPKHKRGGSRTKKNKDKDKDKDKEKAKTPVTSHDTRGKDAFFDEVTTPSVPEASRKAVKEGVSEDADMSDSKKRRRGKRGAASRKRELAMIDDDADEQREGEAEQEKERSESKSKDKNKSKGKGKSKEKLEAWDAASPANDAAVPAKQAAKQEEPATKATSSVAAIVNVKPNKQKRGRSSQHADENSHETRKKKRKGLPLTEASETIGSGVSAWA